MVSTTSRLLGIALGLTLMVGCGLLDGLTGGGGGGAPQTSEARKKLEAGDLVGADAAYATMLGANPADIDATIEAAYVRMLAGDYDGADALLARVEPNAGDKAPGVKLRRALVALRRGGQLTEVQKHGEASGLPEGRLLAAEVLLVDLSQDQAKVLLTQVASGTGTAAETAKKYLEWMASVDSSRQALAETNALWALGERTQAVGAVEQLLSALPVADPDREELLLLWAGRAVTAGAPDVADALLQSVEAPPSGQAWRLQATTAMLHVARGTPDEAIRIFEALDQGVAAGEVPAAGLSDARVTAASLARDGDTARRLLGGAGLTATAAAAAALALNNATDAEGARQVAPPGALKSWLEGK
jgi:thioredoxin-like negative regulator of GroEL